MSSCSANSTVGVRVPVGLLHGANVGTLPWPYDGSVPERLRSRVAKSKEAGRQLYGGPARCGRTRAGHMHVLELVVKSSEKTYTKYNPHTLGSARLLEGPLPP